MPGYLGFHDNLTFHWACDGAPQVPKAVSLVLFHLHKYHGCGGVGSGARAQFTQHLFLPGADKLSHSGKRVLLPSDQ